MSPVNPQFNDRLIGGGVVVGGHSPDVPCTSPALRDAAAVRCFHKTCY